MFSVKPQKLILEDNSINFKLLVKLIDTFKTQEVDKLKNLYNHYNRPISDDITINLEKYITDTIVYYTFGEPIQYANVSEEFINNMTMIDEDSHNVALAIDQSVFGRAYEYIAINEEGEVDLINLSPLNTFVIYSNDIVPKPILGVYMTEEYDEEDGLEGYNVLCWSDAFAYKYYGQDLDKLQLIEVAEHYFGGVPVLELKNNKEEKPDFADVIGLIEAYEQLQTDRVVDKNQFVNKLLVIINSSLGDTDEEFQESKKILKEGGILELSGSGENTPSAQFISQAFNEADVDILKKSLENDIFRMAKIPNLADESFTNAQSGISLRYKLYGTEIIAQEKERNFKRMLRQRLEMINNIYNLKNVGMELGDIDIIFVRNIPTSSAERLEELQGTEGILSLATRIMRYDPEIDVDEEMKKIEEEKSNEADLVNRQFSNYVINQNEDQPEEE